MKRKAIWLIALSIILVLTTVACGMPASTLSDDEQTAIYAAVVRQLYESDEPPDNFPIIYLMRSTDDSVGVSSAPKSKSRNLGRKIQRELPVNLKDLRTQFMWIDSADTVPRDSSGKVKNGGAIITLGNAHLQEDGSVLVSASLYAAPNASTGKTYLIEEINGVWQIVGD